MFICIVGGGLLAAHSINAFVADALQVAPLATAVSQPPDGSRLGVGVTASYSPTRYADDVRSSGLFALPSRQEQDNSDGSPSAPVRASLGAAAKISLIGVVMGDREGVFAIVEERASKNQTLYRLHDYIPDVGEISDIRRTGIVVRQGNLEELVELTQSEQPLVSNPGVMPPPPASALPTSSMKKVIDRREVDHAMSDLPKLLTQARAVPYMVNGAINGFRIDYMAPASFYEKIGIRTGDILQRVNGVEIRDPGTVLNLLQQLKNENVVKLDIVRNNQRATVTYELR
jgi:general secretion pathway protein C